MSNAFGSSYRRYSFRTTISDYFSRSKSKQLFLDVAGDSMIGTLDMQNNKLINIPTPVNENDCVNKKYVDKQSKNKVKTYPSKFYSGSSNVLFINIDFNFILFKVLLNKEYFNLLIHKDCREKYFIKQQEMIEGYSADSSKNVVTNSDKHSNFYGYIMIENINYLSNNGINMSFICQFYYYSSASKSFQKIEDNTTYKTENCITEIVIF